MRIHRNFFYLALVLTLAACGGGNSSENQTESTTESTAEEMEAPEEVAEEMEATAPTASEAIRLAGAYATSVALPHADNNLSRMFDGNTGTAWATMPGAGMDEGIMLYFSEPISFSGINLTMGAGSLELQNTTVYVNGAPQYAYYEDGVLQAKATDAKSVFIRFLRIRGLENVFFQKGGESWMSQVVPQNAQLKIAELSLASADGRATIPLLPPQGIVGSVIASSSLQPVTAYGPRNLFDGRKEFAWVEGAKGNGKGETLVFGITDALTVTGLQLANGFQRSDSHFSANGRLKTATFSSGQESRALTFKDVQGNQVVSFDPIQGSTFELKIGDAYPGEKYQDLVLSELTFITPEGPVSLLTAKAESVKKDLLAKAKGTPLAQYLDRRIENSVDGEGGGSYTLILRSDYTFVMYERGPIEYIDGGETQRERLADGSWEYKEGDGNSVRIRVFGKLLNISMLNEYYGENSEDSYERIFQDFLTITDEKIEGERFFETFWYPIASE